MAPRPGPAKRSLHREALFFSLSELESLVRPLGPMLPRGMMAHRHEDGWELKWRSGVEPRSVALSLPSGSFDVALLVDPLSSCQALPGGIVVGLRGGWRCNPVVRRVLRDPLWAARPIASSTPHGTTVRFLPERPACLRAAALEALQLPTDALEAVVAELVRFLRVDVHDHDCYY